MKSGVSAVCMAILVVLAVAAAGLSLASQSTAASSRLGYAVSVSPTIYWSEGRTGSETEPGTIAVAGRHGVAGPDQRFVVGTTGGADIAIGGDYIYWANAGNGTIGRADLDGAHVNESFITGASSPIGVAVDNQHIYWSNGPYLANEPSSWITIGRADLDGSNVKQDFIVVSAAESEIDGLAVDGQHIYWADITGDRIGRADLDGTHVDLNFITRINEPDGVAINSSYIYWSDDGDGTIGRASLDGSDVYPHCIVPSGMPIGNVPEGVTADGRNVFWTNYPGNTIGRANLDGTSVESSFAPAMDVPEGIAVSGSSPVVPAPVEGGCTDTGERVLLGRFGLGANAEAAGWGTVAPPVLSNGGVSASGTISSITWSSWGGPTAEGQGFNPEYLPQGGYYPNPATIQLRVSSIRSCAKGSPPSYTVLMTREQIVPGGPFGPWSTDPVDLCSGYGI